MTAAYLHGFYSYLIDPDKPCPFPCYEVDNVNEWMRGFNDAWVIEDDRLEAF